VSEARVERNGITARYVTTGRERRLEFDRSGLTVTLAQNRDGYGMLKVRAADDTELERYYGFEMALDHAAEVLGVDPETIPVPEPASDMGM
jgi:CO/xanthine dehydrogenase Mo-binding subunit